MVEIDGETIQKIFEQHSKVLTNSNFSQLTMLQKTFDAKFGELQATLACIQKDNKQINEKVDEIEKTVEELKGVVENLNKVYTKINKVCIYLVGLLTTLFATLFAKTQWGATIVGSLNEINKTLNQ